MMKTNAQRMSAAQFHYDNLHEEDFNPVSAVDQFLESTEGSNWLHGQAVALAAGFDSDFITQFQFRAHISEHLSCLEWDEDQDSAQIDLIIMACNGASGAQTVAKRLVGADGLEGLAKDLLIISGAIELHLTL